MRENLPRRKNIRLKYYDYSQEGMYFITICVKNRTELLGKIIGNRINLTEEGILAKENIKKIEKIYSNIKIDEYVIMPNHIHIILKIDSKNGITISRVIKQYKESITKKIGYTIFQKLFFEHIIRNEEEYIQIKEYVQDNVKNGRTHTVRPYNVCNYRIII